jgi:crotonobetainyl-CoA:carnitine CoA-transferase CaiB-like acyl-CoA transferase
MVQRIAHPTAGEIGLVGVPFKFSETPAGIDRPPPLLGEHTDTILKEVGFGDEEVAELRAKGVI